ncbi:hypothetical protein MINS_05670 [Mycolicibacterium insubricum]|nr:hypothetical protein MINS_05670 [Mycolicibacterium insubricum]
MPSSAHRTCQSDSMAPASAAVYRKAGTSEPGAEAETESVTPSGYKDRYLPFTTASAQHPAVLTQRYRLDRAPVSSWFHLGPSPRLNWSSTRDTNYSRNRA